MKKLTHFIGVFFSLVMLMAIPGVSSAQSWKPMCLNGGNSAGNHNSTWQKVNTPTTGGTTWKKAGGCIAPPPPTCSNGAANYPTCTFPTCSNGATDYPTCTPPLRPGIDLSGIPNPIVSASGDPNKQQWAQLTFGTDGVWTVQVGDFDPNYTATGPNQSGRYLTNGAVATDYEIMISNYRLQNGSTGATASGESSDVFLNKWTNAGTGYPGYGPVVQFAFGLIGCHQDGDCQYGGAPTVTYTITVRRIDDHSQTASINMTMNTYQSF